MRPVGTAYKALAAGMFILLILPLSSCREVVPDSGRPRITVSILPQKFIVDRIGGGLFDVQVMVPPGESPATYDPTAEQMILFSRSAAYLQIGNLGFENTWIPELAADHPGIAFFDISGDIERIPADHEGSGHDHGDADPHVWMSALNMKKLAVNTAAFLSEQYPDAADSINRNLKRFINKTDSLHRFILWELDPVEDRKFIIYHPALTYFAKDYGLEQIPLEREGKEPSAKYMKRLIDRAKLEGIRKILVQRQFSIQEARTVEKEINGRIIVIDPLEYDWFRQMKYIAEELKKKV